MNFFAFIVLMLYDRSCLASYMYVWFFMTRITALVFCARSQDSSQSVSAHRVRVVFSTAGFKGKGKPRPKTRETAALRRGIQKASRSEPGSDPSHWCTSSRLYRLCYPSAPILHHVYHFTSQAGTNTGSRHVSS